MGKIRALIADDSDSFAQRIDTTLTKLGGIEIVRRVRNVPEAAEAIRDLRPDVVILDISMPGGSGIDVLAGMKRNRQTSTVIVLTNYSYPQYRKKCLQLGARYFFDKVELERVAEVLQGLGSGCSKNQEPADGASRGSQATKGEAG